jgi:HD-like signal output (HDOD) protein
VDCGKPAAIAPSWGKQRDLTLTSTQAQPAPNAAFEFVRSLAGELSSGKIELPSFPEVAIRVRQVLSDPDSSIEKVVRVVGSEPALAARLMRVSNASAFNRSGKPITDLRTAINRIGYSMVRSAAIAFAMSQMRRGNKLEALESRMNDLWQRSTLVAAFAFVVARTCSRVNPDEAMLTGMMHGIGKLYIMTRAARHPELFTDDQTLDGILNDWHAAVGKAILENWNFADSIAQAVGEQDDFSRDEDVEADLRDVVAMAILLASYSADSSGLEVALEGLPAKIRLGLDKKRTHVIMDECAAEVAALSSALGA